MRISSPYDTKDFAFYFLKDHGSEISLIIKGSTIPNEGRTPDPLDHDLEAIDIEFIGSHEEIISTLRLMADTVEDHLYKEERGFNQDGFKCPFCKRRGCVEINEDRDDSGGESVKVSYFNCHGCKQEWRVKQ